jgi:hypothetical protein
MPAYGCVRESIYQAVYQPGSALKRPSILAPHRRSPLRTDRDHRRAQIRGDRRRQRFEQPMLTIHEHSLPPDDRSEAGNREGDLIVGKDGRSSIDTMVRNARPDFCACCIWLSVMATHRTLRSNCGWATRHGPAEIDHLGPGHGNSRHLTIAISLGAKVYFCDSRSPRQRGSNENMNGLLSDYSPKHKLGATTPTVPTRPSRCSRRTSTPRGNEEPATSQIAGGPINRRVVVPYSPEPLQALQSLRMVRGRLTSPPPLPFFELSMILSKLSPLD